jgi:hypothetical protein
MTFMRSFGFISLSHTKKTAPGHETQGQLGNIELRGVLVSIVFGDHNRARSKISSGVPLNISDPPSSRITLDRPANAFNLSEKTVRVRSEYDVTSSK